MSPPQKNQKRIVQGLPFVRSIPTENHPLVKLWNGMKAMGLFPQFESYADYRANPGKKGKEEKRILSEEEIKIICGKEKQQ